LAHLLTTLCYHHVAYPFDSNLAGVLLQLKALGIDNVLRFSFVSPPPAIAMQRGLELLYALYAIDETGQLTDPLGVHFARLC
jgi:ATP-dependent RNA helicase DDX35